MAKAKSPNRIPDETEREVKEAPDILGFLLNFEMTGLYLILHVVT